MEHQDPPRFIVQGHPTEPELTAVLCALEAVTTSSTEPATATRPRGWQRTSWRSHEHQLLATLPPGADGGHRHLSSQVVEES